MTLSDRRLQRAYAPRPADYIEPDPTFRFSVIGAALHRARFARAFNAAAAVTFRMPSKKRKVWSRRACDLAGEEVAVDLDHNRQINR
jgi:hypothetical protein